MSTSVEYLTSDIVPIKHGFFTRYGGVSTGRFDSLNVTDRVGDSTDNAEENRRRAITALGGDVNNFAFLDELAHSDKLFVADDLGRGQVLNGYDAIMTGTPDTAIAISVADCAVVIITTKDGRAVGLAHSGWRSTKLGICKTLVEEMQKAYAVQPNELVAAIGPSIQVASYPVGQEVAESFDEKHTKQIGDKTCLDLPGIIRSQLEALGISAIDDLAIDTLTDERFFSWRRDDGDTGRFLVTAICGSTTER